MRAHDQIITDAGGPHALARLLLPHLTIDEVTLQKRVRAWALTPSIPGEYWPLLASLSVASLEELAAAAAVRKAVPLAANDASPQERAA
jgi:hypothetical protein